MNENNYATGTSTEAIERLQAKRKAVTKTMFLIIFTSIKADNACLAVLSDNGSG